MKKLNTINTPNPAQQTQPQQLRSPQTTAQQRIREITTFQPQQQEDLAQKLAAQAQYINQMARELEQAILDLKAIAAALKCDRTRRRDKQQQTALSCEYTPAIVPCVKRKQGGTLVLTTRPVDLFRAEREAHQLAQTLRRLAKKKRKGLLLNRKNQRRMQTAPT